MLNVLSHRGSTSQNDSEISFYTVRMTKIKITCKATWDWPRQSVHSRQLCSLLLCGTPNSGIRCCLWLLVPYSSYWVDLSSVNTWRVLSLTAAWYVMYCWYSWETCPFPNRKGGIYWGCGNSGRGRKRDWQERRKGKLGLGCQINKFIKNELGLLAYSQAILSILSTKCQSQDSTVDASPGSSNLWICLFCGWPGLISMAFFFHSCLVKQWSWIRA